MSARSLFVTGTDTGVGKTHASTALLHALRARGLRATGMKPVASGCARGAGGWRNDDALALRAASDPVPPYEDVNPYPLPEPTAPQLAARAAGVAVALEALTAAHARLAAQCDVVVVEGAGGWLAPLADGLEHADLARALDAEVLLVVGLRLGCLNHARLSARAIVADGARLAGWIGNTVDPGFAGQAGYLDLVADALPAPCWGVLPHRPGPDAREAAAALRLPAAWARR
ncbi:dethiobiotin synthase [Luteimonas huabeiensis]|uniref:dethiobiotin synthase n=1 Tax=Luteimonas huabeiensis TaxID=1244513 RepID=UPI000464EED7|nr:dethiobiotin synthase [Luteimonas huabeiensis]